jgi:hypothetical protein
MCAPLYEIRIRPGRAVGLRPGRVVGSILASNEP